MTSRMHPDESASLPLVLLASIVLAGVVVVMFGQVRTAQETSRQDRDFHQAVHVADAGLQAAFVHVASRDPDDPALPEVGGSLTSAHVTTETAVEASLGEGVYSWEARRVGPRSWEVRSIGRFRDAERYLEMSFGPEQLFFTAIWGDDKIEGNYNQGSNPHVPSWHDVYFGSHQGGGTGAYDGGSDLPDEEIAAGTRDTCELDVGPDVDLDAILYADESDVASIGDCRYRGEPINPTYPAAVTAFQPGDVCDESEFATGGYPDYPDYFEEDETIPNEITLTRGEFYCFQNMDWTTNHVLRLSEGTGAVDVYVREDLSVSGQPGQNHRRMINVDPDDGPPDAADLRLWFAGDGQDLGFTGNNHAWIGASIYAPGRSCNFNAQTTIYGAVVCNSFVMESNGGFSLWYDVRTRDIGSDQIMQRGGWREEFPSTTGFAWVSTG